jgi:DNA-binding NtrC family response regulator
VEKPVQILVVSSEFTNCDVLKDIINREGWKMSCSSTVRECREVLANENIDLVLSDRRLADGTYRDVLVIMRLLRPHIHMIVTSRLADWDEYLEALRDGAFDLIASPSRAADLVRAISQAQSENQKIGRAVALDYAPMNGVGEPLEPPFTVSKSTSIERYPLMTSPIGPSPQTSRTED